MGQDEYVFDEQDVKVKKGGGAGKFLWNSRTKEFLGRDGASWGKVSLFYSIFYLGLGSFFIGMLAVFIQIMPKDKPTYYGESSVMNSRGYTVNPGLGFRPQIDVEDSLISYNPDVLESVDVPGHRRFVKNLKNFLAAKYPKEEGDMVDALDCKMNETYADQLEAGKYCKFDYETIFESSGCTEADDFGYQTKTPCVLIKLNKIVSWMPQDESKGYIGVTCGGETAVDQDNVKKVTYFSEDGTNEKEGRLQSKYYPFYSQIGYKAPFIWAKFEVTTNTLVNIECVAHAKNIDYERMNKRGLTKFSLFVATDEKNGAK